MISTLDGWFKKPGAYVLVDGQFGSTGKGLFAAYLTKHGFGHITHVTSNAGPNSGHTAFYKDVKIISRQIPVSSIIHNMMDVQVKTVLNAGAIIDMDVLSMEEVEFGLDPKDIMIHPRAVLISQADKQADQKTLNNIASTGKGTGPAMARKIMRDGKGAIMASILPPDRHYNPDWDNLWNWKQDVVLVETAQGFSLGINSKFYPHVTGRECTVMQAIADARIPAQMVRKVVACYRTLPIRVGNTSGSSGSCYPDQREMSWAEVGVKPEYTTVTGRERRVFSWSRFQFRESVAANRPDVIFLNFCNYLTIKQLDQLYISMVRDYEDVMGRRPDEILMGFGPKDSSIKSSLGVV